jgi:O-antigen/teichoic acid export membrane protein
MGDSHCQTCDLSTTPQVEISKRLVLINTASGILAKMINVSVLVWLHQYLLRRISAEEYSLLPLLLSVIVLLPLLTSILTAGLGRFVLEAYARGDHRGVTQIVSTMFPLLLAAAFLILSGGLVFAWYIDKVLCVPPERLWDARIMMVLLVFSAAVKPPCTAFSVGFYVRQKFVLYNVLGVGIEMLRVFLLFVLLFGISTRVLWVVVANVAAELVMTIVTLTVSRRMIPALRFRAREIQWERARELMSFGGWSFAGEFATRLRETAVLLILNRFATPLDVTVFSLGSLGRRQIETWMSVLASPLYPVVTGMYALGANERVRAIYMRGGRFALWILLPILLPAAIYAEPIIRLYAGPEYLEAAVVMILMLACLVAAGGTWMIWQVANATGRVRATGIYILTTQPLIVALTFCVVRLLGWGASGVAAATLLVTSFSSFFIAWPLGLRLADVTFGAWIRQTLIPGFAPACVAAMAWSGLGVIFSPKSWIGVGLCAIAGLLCYAVVLLKFCLESRDQEDLAVVFGRARSLAQHLVRGVKQRLQEIPDVC